MGEMDDLLAEESAATEAYEGSVGMPEHVVVDRPNLGRPTVVSVRLTAEEHGRLQRAAVEVEAELRTEAAQPSQFGRVDFGQIGVAFEDFTEAIFHEDGQAEVGAEAFENVERGCGEDAIAQASQPEDGNPAAPRQTFQDAVHGLFFDFRLVHQHHRDVVANRVHAMALDALQAALVGIEFDRGLTQGTHEDFEQIFTDSHSESPV